MTADTIILIIFLSFFIPLFWAASKALGQNESDPKFWFGVTVFKGPMDRRYLWVIVPCGIGLFLTVIIVNILFVLGYIELGTGGAAP
jgi:hypothetical protein